MAHSPSFFDLADRYAALSATGDPLERLSRVVDFEMFRAALDAALKRSDCAKGEHVVDTVAGGFDQVPGAMLQSALFA